MLANSFMYFRIVFLTILLGCYTISYGQKRIIDSTAYKSWSIIKHPYISNDGKYVKYDSVNELSARTVVKSIDGKWSKIFLTGDVEFVGDDKFLLCRNKDSITLYQVGTERKREFPAINYYNLKVGGKDMLLFQGNNYMVSIFNIKDGSLSSFELSGVISQCEVVPNSRMLFIHTKSPGDSDRLQTFDIVNRHLETIASNVFLQQYKIAITGKSVAYLTLDSSKKQHLSIWRAENGSLNDVNLDFLLSKANSIDYIYGFSKNEDSLKILIKNIEYKQRDFDNSRPKVRLWSYRSNDLLPYTRSDNDKQYSLSLSSGKYTEDINGNPTGMAGNVLDSLKQLLGRTMFYSPEGKYIIYALENNYWSLNVETGNVINLTGLTGRSWTSLEDGDYDVMKVRAKIVGWGRNEDYVYIKDEFDIWRFSLDAKEKPKNITNGLGRRNRISFEVINQGFVAGTPYILSNEPIIFSAFNTETKQNGFYQKNSFKESGDPELLTMDDAMYWIPMFPVSYAGLVNSSDFPPKKAKKSNIYLVAKSTSKSSTNLYVTSDFRNFRQVSFNYPEKEYNWVTTELVRWRNKDGQDLKGILYKPENFDSTKKYPVIFYYYRKPSDNLNTFIIPRECPGCIIDIPGYVSNEYLVFTPDIYFRKGETGKSALDAVTSAAEFLLNKPFIDGNKMGIQGCSFSGFTTNYIVTHSNIFAAACSASGLSDLISGYNSIISGSVKQPDFETGSYQIGGTLWDQKEKYIENSAIFSVDKLSTPFLMMHTTHDGLVPFNNAMEFFLAAKRLKKKVWLLQYDEQSHAIYGKEGKDFNIRMRQFFDYYLKGSMPPKWLTAGGTDFEATEDKGFELDSSGIKP